MNFDDHKELFTDEARERIAAIEADLLKFEETPDNPELVHSIFRHLHTLKGSGIMFGFTELADFAHGLENLFDHIRGGSLRTNQEIIDLTYSSVDCLHGLLAGAADIQQCGLIQDTIKKLLGGANPAAAGAEPPAASGPAYPEDGQPRMYRISFAPHKDILFRGVKIEALFRELRAAGKIYPLAATGQVPELEELSPTSVYLSWVISCSTAISELDLSSVFLFVEDYAELKIERVDLTDPHGQAVVPRIGEILAGRGSIDYRDIEDLRDRQKPFGTIAVETGKISEAELKAALAEQAMAKAISSQQDRRKDSSSIRVRKEKLDYLVDTVGELVILQERLRQEAKNDGNGVFLGISEELKRLTADLRDATMGIRMVPLEESFASFKRLVRDLGAQLGKELELTLRGSSTEMDKNIIDALKDPLVHIIRNSADHGIERADLRQQAGKPPAGQISIEARHQGAKVEIEITDDGAGLNTEAIRQKAVGLGLIDTGETDPKRIQQLIFEPGFSTAAKTTGVSGRGVGMDVVKKTLERIRGDILVESRPGQGTSIVLSIPLTLVIIDGLLVRVGESFCILNLNQVEECVDLEALSAQGRTETGLIRLRDSTIPVLDLRRVFGLPEHDSRNNQRLVIANSDGEKIALRVDAVAGKTQVVIKPFTMRLPGLTAVSGASVLGDGSIALILNIREIVKTQYRTAALSAKESL